MKRLITDVPGVGKVPLDNSDLSILRALHGPDVLNKNPERMTTYAQSLYGHIGLVQQAPDYPCRACDQENLVKQAVYPSHRPTGRYQCLDGD